VIMAVAHFIMVSVFPMLTRQEPYHELGARYFDERRRHYTVDRLTWRIERLGIKSISNQ
jgi:transposase